LRLRSSFAGDFLAYRVEQRFRDLGEMKTRPCVPGKINAPPRLTSQTSRRRHFRLFLRPGPVFQEHRSEEEKAANCGAKLSQVHVLAAFWPLKSNFLWGGTDCKSAGFTPSVVRIHSCPYFATSQTRLARRSLGEGGRLRMASQASPRAILQGFKPFGWRLGILPPPSGINPFPTCKNP
jgi:hypothetical protein